MDQRKNQNETIEKFMSEYLQNQESIENQSPKEDLIVNFDISYADGKSESFVCGSESNIFGNYREEYNEEKIDKIEKEEEEEYDKEKDNDDIKFYYNEQDYDYGNKWSNCEDEITERFNDNKDDNYNNYDKHERYKKHERVKGDIVVYSTLKTIDGTRIKGVKINLYKINGISPELVESLETDNNGKVVFEDIPEGNYRVIEIIDKRYFTKPNYVNWNEVSIDCNNNSFVIYAVNNINEKCTTNRR